MWSNSNYLPGIDVSHYQKAIEWQKVKDSGVAFTFIKATEGVDFYDEYFDINWSASRRAGVIRGAYHFFLPSVDPVEQANHYLNVVGDILHSSDLPPVLDLESSPKYVYESFLPLSIEERQQRMETWLNVVAQATNRQPIIYTNLYTWKIFMGNTEDYVKYPLWIANYGAEQPSVPANNWGGQGWLLWQFSYQGSVPGIYNEAAVVDQNVFKGNLQDMQDWLGIEEERKLPPKILNHQMVEAFSRSADHFDDSVEDWILKTNLSYMLKSSNAERPYDGPAIDNLLLSDDEKGVLETTIQEIITEYKEDIYSRMTNQAMINACYQAGKKVEIAGWTLLVKAGLIDIVNHRDDLYIGPKVEEMQNLSPEEKYALAEVLGINLANFEGGQGTEPVIEEPVDEEPVVEEPVVEEPVEEDPVNEEPVVEDPVVEDPIIEEPVEEEPVVEEDPDEELPQENDPIEFPEQIFGFPPNTRNQDVINAIYKVAEIFNLSGWALLDFAGLTQLVKDREAAYTGAMIGEMENLSSQQRSALAEILGVVLLESQPNFEDPPDLVDPVFEPGPVDDVPSSDDIGSATYPGITNQDILDAFSNTEKLLDLVGWNLINIVQLQAIADNPASLYVGPSVGQMNGITISQKAVILEMILEQGSLPGEETYPGLVNQDMINMFYQVASQFSEDGWQWIVKSELTYMIASREMRYKPYRGPKIEDMMGFTTGQRQALLNSLGITLKV